MPTDADLLTRIDPHSEVFDDALHDKDEPRDKPPGEEIDPDSSIVDPRRDEAVYDDEDEHRRHPL